MMFKNDITELDIKKACLFIDKSNPVTPPPVSHVFFQAKRIDICEQYNVARNFLYETELCYSKVWGGKAEKGKDDNNLQCTFMSMRLEAALMFYNIVVDLSWVLFCVACEYVHYSKEGKLLARPDDILTTTETSDLLRTIEALVVSPNTKGAPYDYLGNTYPKLSIVTSLMKDFWNGFQSSDIRELYNFLKHRGKPRYTELKKYDHRPLIKMSIIYDNKRHEIPTSSSDVKMEISIKEYVKKLKVFDDELLYPYIKNLLGNIEEVLRPAPYVT